MKMTQKKTKTGRIAVTYAPQFAKLLRAEELKKDKEGAFLVIYQEGEPDSTGDKIYRLGLYKMVQYAPIRQEGNLAELLDFVAQNKNVQILNADAYEEKGAK